MYKKYLLDDEEILWEYIKYKENWKRLIVFAIIIFYGIMSPLFIGLFRGVFISLFNTDMLYFGILEDILTIGIVGLIIILLLVYPIYRFYKVLKRSNLSWSDLDNYKKAQIITSSHIIVKNFLRVDSLVSQRDIKELIGDKIHKHDDWLVFDLDLFDSVEIKEPDRKFTFHFKRLKWIDDLYFSFDEDETSEFEEASRILKNLMEKLRKRREKQGIEEKERIFIPLIGDAKDYLNRSPLDFYTWERISLGILIYLLLQNIVSIFFHSPKLVTIFFLILTGGGIQFLEGLILLRSKLRYRTENVYPLRMIIYDQLFYLVGGIIMAITQWVVMTILTLASGWFYLIGGVMLFGTVGFYLLGYFFTFKKSKMGGQFNMESSKKGKESEEGYFSKGYFLLEGIGSITSFILLIILIGYFDPVELIGTLFLLMIGCSQFFVFFGNTILIEDNQKHYYKLKNILISSVGLFGGIILVFFIVYVYSELTINSVSLFWFPVTLYLGALGLYRWWIGRKSKNMDPFLMRWFKIEGFSTFIYSLGLLLFALLFWEFTLLLLLSVVMLFFGGISFILSEVLDL